MRALFTFVIIVSVSFCFAQTTPTVTGQDRPPTVLELKVADPGDSFHKRQTMISLVRLADSALAFKQIGDSNGLPDLYAADRYNTSVEIVGRDDSVAMVQWTFRMIPNNSAATHEEIGRMGYFSELIGGGEGFKWFSNIYQNFKDKPLEDYTETKQLFAKRFAVFKYLPKERKMTLTITIKSD